MLVIASDGNVSGDSVKKNNLKILWERVLQKTELHDPWFVKTLPHSFVLERNLPLCELISKSLSRTFGFQHGRVKTWVPLWHLHCHMFWNRFNGTNLTNFMAKCCFLMDYKLSALPSRHCLAQLFCHCYGGQSGPHTKLFATFLSRWMHAIHTTICHLF